MSNKKVIDLKPATFDAIYERTTSYFESDYGKRDQLAYLLGMEWSAKSARYVRASHAPIIRIEDLSAKTANPQKY